MINLREELGEMDNFDCTGDLMQAIEEIVEVRGFYKIDWVDALQLMREFSKGSDDKFNIYPEAITSEEELSELASAIYGAMSGTKPMIRRICMDCRKYFYIYLSEKEFLEQRDLALPKRCKDCRKKKRKEKKLGEAS